MLNKDWQYLLSYFAIMTEIKKWDFDKSWAVLQLLNTHICIMKNTDPDHLVIKFRLTIPNT